MYIRRRERAYKTVTNFRKRLFFRRIYFWRRKKEIRDKNKKVKLKTAIEKFDENDENIRKGKRNKKVFETERIFEKNLDKNEYVYVYREINRMHDNYHENVKTEKGEIIHESYEKLSDHIGHGKAKK